MSTYATIFENLDMDRERAREEIKGRLREYVESITERSKGANMYVCPLCGSGTGPNGTGAFSIKDESWHCFSCEEGGDIFDLIGKYENLAEYSEQLTKAGEFFGIEVNSRASRQDNPTERRKQPKNGQSKPVEAQTQDFTDFFIQANKDLDKTSYHRGISKATLDRFQVGYVACWRHPKAPNAPASPRLIIPTSKESYLARDTRSDIPEEQKPYAKSKAGKTHIFNIQALQTAKKPIFVVEGEIDALSVIDAGGEAIGLGSVSMVKHFLQILEANKPAQPLILALDADQRGKEAQAYLETGLKALEVPFYAFNPAKGYKDANEALQANREAFTQAIGQGEKCQLNEYLAECNAHNMFDGFADAAAEFARTSAISTGFVNLDRLLDGGLYPGLYIAGAITSLGKTTFVLQMADVIAGAGHDVLIFSLEMSKYELMAKSLSRLSMQAAEKGWQISQGRTAREILCGEWCRHDVPPEFPTEVYKLLDLYEPVARNVYIVEGSFTMDVDIVCKRVKRHIQLTGKKPVVVVDYLQILAPLSERSTDKQNVDRSVVELKRLSRDCKLPVIAVSSFNRESYTVKASMAAFKESGAIEYTSDVLIAMQLADLKDNPKSEDIAEAKQRNPREIELAVIKNRHGKCGEARFRYYPKFNLFEENLE